MLHVVLNGLKQSNNPNDFSLANVSDNRALFLFCFCFFFPLWGCSCVFVVVFFQNNLRGSGAAPLIFDPMQQELFVTDIFVKCSEA